MLSPLSPQARPIADRPAVPSDAPELRGVWVDTWGNGLLSASQIDALVATARQNHFNAIFPEVRKVADAYYNSHFEPRAANIVDPAPFDPLQYLIDRCHDTSGGKAFIEVHPWLVTYRVWAGGTLPPNHLVHIHPNWVMLDDAGNSSSDGTIYLDPGHPYVEEYTCNVFLDVLQNYQVDGIHFDYVRYPGNHWGYNPAAVARFNYLFGGSGEPSYSDPDWLQWRRDQVTALVRKVYASAVDLKPWIKVSAATVNWGSPNDDFTRTIAYTDPLQDWNGWMAAHILDMNCLMDYADETSSAQRYRDWIDFAVSHRSGRHAVIGQGSYLNTISDSMTQLLAARSRAPDGLMVYSYRSTNSEGQPNSAFYSALAGQVFTGQAPLPTMPWKTSPTHGIFKGSAYSVMGSTIDGATVSVDGTSFRMRTDGTGFYAFMDVPPGTYTLRASHPEFGEAVSPNQVIAAGDVTTVDLVLIRTGNQFIVDNTDPGFTILSGNWQASSWGNVYGPNKLVSERGDGSGRVRWTWSGIPSGTYRVEFWIGSSTYAADARYTVHHDGGEEPIIANQYQVSDGWHSLGSFGFGSGSATVTLSDYWEGLGAYVVADAIRLVQLTSMPMWRVY